MLILPALPVLSAAILLVIIAPVPLGLTAIAPCLAVSVMSPELLELPLVAMEVEFVNIPPLTVILPLVSR